MDETTIEIDPARRHVQRGGKRLALHGRALDLLLALAMRPGDFVDPETLLRAVWPGRAMEPNNLRVQVFQLRRQIGTRAVEMVPGRGYRLALPVRQAAPAATRLVGREAESAQLAARAAAHALVTVTGAGGIGKTTLVRAWFDALPAGPDLAKGWVDLSSAAEGALLAPLAAALGVPDAARVRTPQALAAAVPPRDLHLVLDNAEHMVAAVAAVLGALLAALPRLHVVVTSQLPLRLPQEQLLRLGPLEVPDAGAGPAEAMRHAALQLFVERVRAVDPDFTLDGANAAPAVALCRSLDGVPLALELAAARVPALGLDTLVRSLDERLALLASPAHGRPGRQQTLRAALDWTCALLDADTRRVWERLGVFAGPFTLQAAVEVATDAPGEGPIDPARLIDAIGTLVDASLLAAERDGDEPAWRLPDTARLHALQRLQDGGLLDTLRRRHLAWCLRWVDGADAARLAAGQAQLQAALDWALSGGDSEAGAVLAEHLAAHPGLAALREKAPASDGTLAQLLARLESAGLSRRAELAGLHRRTLLAMAHRLRPAEAQSVDAALQELQLAVDLARAALAPPADEPAPDAFVDGVLAEVAECTRHGDFDLGSERVDDALAELERREARRRAAWVRQQRALLASGLQQDLLRRDPAAVARRTEALLALDGPGHPTHTAAWREQEAQALRRAENGIGLLWIDVTAELARRRLAAAPDAAGRADAHLVLARALVLRGARLSSPEPLADAVAVCREALAGLPPPAGGPGAALHGALHHHLADALRQLGLRRNEPALLEDALVQADAALALRPRNHDPLAWAATMHLRGDTLGCLGRRELGSTRLQQAADTLRAALAERTAERAPLDRARTLNMLSVACSMMAQRDSDLERHHEVLALQQAALALVPRDEAPALWGSLCNNIGNAHTMLARAGAEPEAHWRGAVEAFQRALTVRTRDAAPRDWAYTQHNLAATLLNLGTLLDDRALLAEAAAAFESVLPEHTRALRPSDWASSRHGLASATLQLGRLTPGPQGRSLLERALALLHEVQPVYRRETMPHEWLMVQCDVVGAQLHLGMQGPEAHWVETAADGARWLLAQPEAADAPQQRDLLERHRDAAQRWRAAHG